MEILCKIRDIQRGLEQYEQSFETVHGMSVKEGMLLCSISESQIKAGDIAEKIMLSCSNCSKILSSAEKKGYISRTLGDQDKRTMYVCLTKKGKEKLESIYKTNIPLPDILG